MAKRSAVACVPAQVALVIACLGSLVSVADGMPAPPKPVLRAPHGIVQAGGGRGANLEAIFNTFGQFTLRRVSDGKWILYQAPETSYLSVRVDDEVYTDYNDTLIVTFGPTWVTPTLCRTVFSTAAGVEVTQDVELDEDAAIIRVTVLNGSAMSHDVGIRYLFDTQVGLNDGSPLSASGVTDPTTGSPVCTHETDMPLPAFDIWYSYDTWPGASLSSVGTLVSRPSRMVFAWWPAAVGCTWDYTPDPTRAFYTPGYTVTPTSDSCVLVYFSPIELPPGTSREVTTAYGFAPPPVHVNRDLVIQRLLALDQAIQTAVDSEADVYADILARSYDRIGILGARTLVTFLDSVATGTFLRLASEPAGIAAALNAVADPLGWSPRTQDLAGWGREALLARGLQEMDLAGLRAHFRQAIEAGGHGVPGAADYKEAAHALVADVIDALPDPLPPTYPGEYVCGELADLTRAVLLAAHQETLVGAPCSYGDLPLGSMLTLGEPVRNAYAAYDQLLNVAAVMGWSYMGSHAEQVATWASGILAAPSDSGGGSVLPLGWNGILPSYGVAPSELGPATAGGSELAPRHYLVAASAQAMHYFHADMQHLLALASAADGYLPDAQLAYHLSRGSETPVVGSGAVWIDSAPDVIIPEGESAGWATVTVTARNDAPVALPLRVRGQLFVVASVDGTPLPLGQPVAMQTTEPVEVAPGAEETFTLEFPVAVSQLSGGDTYLVAAYLCDGPGVAAGPAVAVLHAGTADIVASLAGQVWQVLASGWIGSGQTVDVDLNIGSDVPALDLVLVSPTPEADLHLYRGTLHVGLDYDSGVVEQEIPGAAISAPGTTPEVIHFGAPAPTSYLVSVVGRAALEPTPYVLLLITAPERPAALAVLPTGVRDEVYTGDLHDIVLAAQEVSGQQDLTDLALTPTPLSDGLGHTIGVERMNWSVGQTSVGAGSAAPILLTVDIAEATGPGAYRGSVVVTARQGAGGSLVSRTMPLALDVIQFFSDVPTDYWSRKFIQSCLRALIVQGYPGNIYLPELPVTRDQMAVFIARCMAGGDDRIPEGPPTPTFPDVGVDQWAYKWIEYLHDAGVVQGYSDGYHPEYEVDRGQMAVFVARAMAGGDSAIPEGPAVPTFSDVAPDHWAYKWIEYAHEAGVVNGYQDGYHPEYVCTRDQMAVFVTRAFGIGL